MTTTRLIRGGATQGEHPVWGTLEALLGDDELCGHFMWMFSVDLEDGRTLNAYKHRWTRRYFHLTDELRTFLYTGENLYREIDRRTAIQQVFIGWDRITRTE